MKRTVLWTYCRLPSFGTSNDSAVQMLILWNNKLVNKLDDDATPLQWRPLKYSNIKINYKSYYHWIEYYNAELYIEFFTQLAGK